MIRFETAWSMPKPIYQAMARKFPHLEFVIRYADEDFGNNCGFILLRNGKWEYDYIAPANNEQSSEEKSNGASSPLSYVVLVSLHKNTV